MMIIKRILLTAVLLLCNVSIISSQQQEQQQNDDDDASSSSTCRAPKPTATGGILSMKNASLPREYIVGANTWHVPVLDYLTNVIGPMYDPPISFKRFTSNLYMKTSSIQESMELYGYDFMIANPYVTSCYESEGAAISLATQIVKNYNPRRPSQSYNLTKYGGTLYVLKNRTDIQTIHDVKDKIIGTNKITNLATHLCYDVLLRNGIHHLQDPKQTIFFKNSNDALHAVLHGLVDVGCAATSVLEKYTIDPISNELLDVDSTIRILHPQQHIIDDGNDDEETTFPFAISSALVPGYQATVFPHVQQSVKLHFQQELIAMRDHADVAPSLLGCINDADDGCNLNDTECVNRCFDSLPSSIFKNCDTTPELALSAYHALNESGLIGFTEPLQNFRLRDIQETTGFLRKDFSSIPESSPASSSSSLPSNEPQPTCVRMKNIVDATTCPKGHFVRTNDEIIQQCNVSGLQCYDRDCICKPCVKAYEVDFFPVEDVDHVHYDDYTILNSASRSSYVGSGCSKFSLCGKVEQEHVLTFYAIDNKERPNATMTGAFLLPDETEEPFTFDNYNGTFQYDFFATETTVGQKTVKIRINNEEIPESPFRIIVLKRDCAADTGNERREPDELGSCVCKRGMVELVDKCIPLAILLPSIFGPALVLFLIAVHLYVQYKKEQSDNIWKLDPTELFFDDPPRVLGRGTFGLVLLAEYRGTAVAVKRILPRSNRLGSGMPSHVEFQKMNTSEQAIGGEGTNNGLVSGLRSGFSSMSSPSVVMKAKAARMKVGIEEDLRGLSDRLFWRRKAERHFVEEIRLLSKLRHPSITTVMGAVISKKSEPMLVMEYMHFGSLHDLLHNESMVLEGEVLVGVLQDVASGLRFLHSSDPLVLHGDLKSQNILVDDKFRAKVADFGCGDFGTSHSTGSLRQTKARGTPYWMAPELIRGDTKNTKASDVYAFGIVIYEVFSRSEPYLGEPYDEVLRLVSCKDANKRPPVPENCPDEAAKMMQACLKWDPAERPTATGLDICLRWMDGSSVKSSEITSRQKKKTEASRTDDLLEQMFPTHIAEALKEGRKVAPETHEEVTIVFSEIVEYTEIASAMSATKVSDLLDRLYNLFDELCDRLEVFKVETIGDAYMTVCNLVKSQPQHASLAAKFAMEAMLLASTVPIDMDDPSLGCVQLRMGFHTGSVVTHVIGTKNPRFTLIGDTVNTAASVENTSEPGKIQCSEESYRLLASNQTDTNQTDFSVKERGIIQVKGKGDMKTFWIEPGPERLECC